MTVTGAIDREQASHYGITIRATSTDSTSTILTKTITIGDVNEFSLSPIVDASSSPNTVIENAAVGTVVGIVAHAYDTDATSNNVYVFA